MVLEHGLMFSQWGNARVSNMSSILNYVDEFGTWVSFSEREK